MPQANWSPALTAANVRPPVTATGVLSGETDVAPLPSWPDRLIPQQYAAPLVVTPHAKPVPALTVVNVRPPATAAGLVLTVVVPLPSCAEELAPQQYAARVVAMPQAKK